jgi:hypothetical protein
MVVDQATKKNIPGVTSMFFTPPYAASGCFNSATLSDDIIRKSKVHINPKKSVELTENKDLLFNKLAQSGYPVPPQTPYSQFSYKSTLDLGEFEEFLEQGSAVLQRNGSAVELSSLIDILTHMDASNEHSVLLRPNPLLTQRGFAQVIPNAHGKALPRGQHLVRNGVLSTNIPGSEMCLPFLGIIKDVVDDLGLDYARIEIAFDSDGNLEILNVDTKLRQADIPPIRGYMDILANASKFKHKLS